MSNQTIPIVLTWGPVAPGTQAADINQLGTLLAAQLSGAIRADVSFVTIVLNDPTTYQGALIYNSTQRVFKAWDTASGSYIALTQFAVGDVKNTFVGTDTVATGWVILNGRTISAVPGLTQNQITNLTVLFPAGTLPTVTAPATTVGTLVAAIFAGLPT